MPQNLSEGLQLCCSPLYRVHFQKITAGHISDSQVFLTMELGHSSHWSVRWVCVLSPWAWTGLCNHLTGGVWWKWRHVTSALGHKNGMHFCHVLSGHLPSDLRAAMEGGWLTWGRCAMRKPKLACTEQRPVKGTPRLHEERQTSCQPQLPPVAVPLTPRSDSNHTGGSWARSTHPNPSRIPGLQKPVRDNNDWS